MEWDVGYKDQGAQEEAKSGGCNQGAGSDGWKKTQLEIGHGRRELDGGWEEGARSGGWKV